MENIEIMKEGLPSVPDASPQVPEYETIYKTRKKVSSKVHRTISALKMMVGAAKLIGRGEIGWTCKGGIRESQLALEKAGARKPNKNPVVNDEHEVIIHNDRLVPSRKSWIDRIIQKHREDTNGKGCRIVYTKLLLIS